VFWLKLPAVLLALAIAGTVLVGIAPGLAWAGSVTSPPVLSSAEDLAQVVSRDSGFSVALPNGKDLWIFGDTTVDDLNGQQMVNTKYVPGSSAAEGATTPGQVPPPLDELPSPVASPAPPFTPSPRSDPSQFIPSPSGVYLPNGSGVLCGADQGQLAERWATGAALLPGTADVLVTYEDVCLLGSWDFAFEGWGFMEYNWQTNTIDTGPFDTFPPTPSGDRMPMDLLFGDPVVTGGQVTLFSSVCTDLYGECFAGHVNSTTFPDTVAALESQSSYVLTPALTDASASWQPASIDVAAYPDAPYRMIETTALDGSYSVLTAPTPSGPWHLQATGRVPGCTGLTNGFCYALIGHPELSTAGHPMISYFDPGWGPEGPTGPVGHVIASLMPTEGYGLLGSDGGMFAFGNANFYGSEGAAHLNEPVVAMAASPHAGGYWLVASDGGVFAFGDARFWGSTGATRLNKPVVGMAATPDGGGYWLVASDGGVFAFGDARFWGSTGATRLNKPIVGMAATPDGGGYWLVAKDGGIFAFGDAAFLGSMGATPLNQPIVGMAADPATGGYWEAAADGGIFAFNAPFYGSMGGTPLNQPIVGIAVDRATGGYWEAAADGGIFAFNAPFYGSMGGTRLKGRVVGIAALNTAG
jgi:hypothetical protein